jgi:NADP-dependent 3-hydroxy acid dehydrogenase YdfG
MPKNEIVFITGASSGIGKACATQFAKSGANLIITARREERLTVLANELEAQYGGRVLPIVLDIQDPNMVKQVIANLPEAWQAIDILVNNAGISQTSAPFHTTTITDWESTIDTNLKGLLYVSQAILPGMITRKKGHIINIGSTAAHRYYAGGHVYCATKHAVKAFSQCLRIDLANTGVRVSEVDPSYTETEFNEVRWKSKEKAADFYAHFKALTADDVARSVVFCALQPAHVNIAEILLYPSDQNAPSVVSKVK